MPFRFKKSETPEEAVRRVGGECVAAALGWLERARRPAPVHSVRKEIKKLRSLLRLVRGEIGADYRRTIKPLRGAADQLAAARDARVIFRALKNLVPDADECFPRLHQSLRRNWRHETRRLIEGNALPEAGRFLRKTARQLRRLELKTSGWPAVAPGLKQSYERGRKTFGQAMHEPSPESFHAWRKQVKNLWYQLQLICPKPSPELRGMIDHLKLLGGHLGSEHDLVLLDKFIDRTGDRGKDESPAVTRLIEARRKEVHQSAMKLGERLFAEEPASVVRRLKKQWRDWRGD